MPRPWTHALVLAAGLLLPLIAQAADTPPADPAGAWAAWIKRGEEAYADRRLATLKIDDAIYMKPNEQAWLVCTQACRWSLTAPTDPAPGVSFDGTRADWRDGADALDLLSLKGAHPVTPAIDVTAMIVQVAPGEEGLRLAAYNQANPAAAAFTGFRFFAYAPGFVVAARFEPGDFAPQDFQTSRGWWKRFYRAGEAVFTREGAEHRVPLYAASPDPAALTEASAFFTDATTGTDSYGVGRYLDVTLQGPGAQTVTLDFNYAYNPACARSPHFNCPVAQTALPFAVTAGEKVPLETPGN